MVPQPTLVGRAAVQRGGALVPGLITRGGPARSGQLIAKRSQPTAHSHLAERDLPGFEPGAPVPGRSGRDRLLGVGMPGLTLADGADRDLVRLGHRGGARASHVLPELIWRDLQP